MKRTFFIPVVLALFFLLSFSIVQAEEDPLPKWVKRIEYSIQLETDKKPTFYFQTVQPLTQDEEKKDTIFIQPRVNIRDERGIYNLGLGYRKLASEDWIVGVNTFLDYQDLHRHARAGLGFEVLGQILEGRVNTYFGGLTNKKEADFSAASRTIERVADGIDYELGAPVPYMSWLKIYGSGFWYDFKSFDDKLGWKSRLEASLNEHVQLEVYTWDDNKGDLEYGGRLRLNVAFNTFSDILGAVKFSQEAFPRNDLKERLLIPVEREYDIILERKVESSGFVVEAGRS